MTNKTTLFLIIALLAGSFTVYANGVDDGVLNDKKPKKEKPKKEKSE